MSKTTKIKTNNRRRK